MRWTALPLAASVAAFGCSPEDAAIGPADASATDVTTDTERDAAQPDTREDADAGRPVCNDLSLADVNAGNARGSTESSPAPTGGGLTDGTYVFVETVFYGVASPGIPFMRSKLMIAGNTWHTIEGDPEPGSVNPDRTFSDTVSVAATTLQVTGTCPRAGEPQTLGFSVETPDATADTMLTLFVEDQGRTAATRFVKR